MTTYIQLLNKIEAFCDAHYQIQRYGGEFREQMPNLSTESEKYPIVFVTPTAGVPMYDTNQISLDIYCVDIIQKGRENLNTIVSDCHLILTDLYGYFSQGSDLSVDVIGLPSQRPLNNLDLDYVAGWVMTIVFEVDGYCVDAIPMGDIPSGGGTCEDATYTITDDAGNTLYSGSITSGGSLNQAINDSTAVLKNTVGTTISTTSINAEGSADITAPDGTVENSDASYTDSVLSNGSLVLPDSQINVNGVDEGDVVSVKTIDVNITDGTDPVTPDSVSLVGNTLTVAVPSGSASIGAKILKTGVSSTSYRTGDDANTDRGRLSSFLVLSSNNVFGNTNRFTDTLGGSVYADGVVLDHSTDDGSEILCYYIGDLTTTRTWADSIDWALGITPLSLSGWGLANINELFEIADKRSTSWLNYSPFNITLQVWSSTAYNSSASLYIYGANRQIQGAGILNNYRAIATRYCTYAELGL